MLSPTPTAVKAVSVTPASNSLIMKHLITILIALGLISTAFGIDRKTLNSNAQVHRANYAMIASESFADDYADNYMLMRHAFLADSSNIDVANEYALALFSGDISWMDESDFNYVIGTVRRWYESNPTDRAHAGIATRFAQIYEDIDWQKTIWQRLIEANRNNPDYYTGYAEFLLTDAAAIDSTYIDTAMSVLNACQLHCPAYDQVDFYLAACYQMKEDTAAFAQKIDCIASSKPTEIERLTTKGSLWQGFCSDTALVYYKQAIALDSTVTGDAYISLMRHYYFVDDTINFNDMARRGLFSPELDEDTRVDYLSLYMRYNLDNETLTDTLFHIYDQMLEMVPGNAKIHSGYAFLLNRKGNTAGALEQYEYACALEPGNESNQYMRFKLTIDSGDTLRAIEVAKECIPYFIEDRIDDNDYGSRRMLPNSFFPLCAAQYMLSTDQPREAIALLDSINITSIISEPDELADIESLYGSAYFAIDELDSAIVHAEAALNHSTSPMLLNNAAYFLAVGNRDLDRADRFIREALYDQPDNPTFLDTYAWVLFRQKNFQGARIQIDKTLAEYDIRTSTNPPAIIDPEPRDTIESDTLALDDEELDDIAPEQITSEIYDHAGDIYFMTGEPQLALLFWQRALALEPDNQRIRRKVDNKTYFFDE